MSVDINTAAASGIVSSCKVQRALGGGPGGSHECTRTDFALDGARSIGDPRVPPLQLDRPREVGVSRGTCHRIFARSVVRTKIALALALAAFGGLGADAGQDRPTFKSSVDLVPISAVVRDGRNRLVTNLTAEDFQVLDNGARCRIVDFQRDRTSPLTVALLMD